MKISKHKKRLEYLNKFKGICRLRNLNDWLKLAIRVNYIN